MVSHGVCTCWAAFLMVHVLFLVFVVCSKHMAYLGPMGPQKIVCFVSPALKIARDGWVTVK